jgi:hypothetical protein
VTTQLYHLPRLLKAAPEEWVYLVEGEKDVHTLEALGLVATTTPGGAQRPWKPQYTEALRHRHVVMLPDNDAAGEQYATSVAHMLADAVASLTVLRLPGLPPKGDVTDWATAGGTPDALAALVQAARVPAPDAVTLVQRCAADVVEADTEWLWWPYIARGALCMIDGDPGQGKSLLTLALAAHLSEGRPLPDQFGIPTLPLLPHATVFFAREDDLATQVKPRLRKMSSAGQHIHYIEGWQRGAEKETRHFTLDDMPVLRLALDTYHPALVVIDPIQAYIGSKVDINRANETRPILDRLAAVAREYNVAIVCVRHMAKGSSDASGSAMMRGLGSVDFLGAARTQLVIERHPYDKQLAILCHTKSNAGIEGRVLLFSKHDGHFEWAGITRLSGEDIAGSGRGPNPRERLKAAFWLERQLQGGIPQASSDLILQAAEEDISERTLMRAKPLLDIQSSKRDGGWYWRLPPLELTPPPPSMTSIAPGSLVSLDPLGVHGPLGTLHVEEIIHNNNGSLVSLDPLGVHGPLGTLHVDTHDDVLHDTPTLESQQCQVNQECQVSHVPIRALGERARAEVAEQSQVTNSHICACGGTILTLAAGRQCVRCNKLDN